MAEVVLEARDASKEFKIGSRLFGQQRVLHAVQSVSVTLRAGETLGVVGESGSGKSTLASMLVGDERPTSGEIELLGEPLHSMSARGLLRARRDIQLVRQDPYTSLNPRMSIEAIVREPFDVHTDVVPKDKRRAAVRDLLDLVGLNPDHMGRNPRQFSGGQRQRVGIARALALRPKVLVCDEPVSALDVSVQAQVINLLQELQQELDLAYVFIAHDLGVVNHIADRIAVMYLGRIVEEAPAEAIRQRPEHPYTKALMTAAPEPTRGAPNAEKIILEGEIPSPLNPPSGCHFRTRCWKAADACAQEAPELSSKGAADHTAACHFPLSEGDGR